MRGWLRAVWWRFSECGSFGRLEVAVLVWVRDVRSIMSYGEECTRKVSMEKEARWREVKLVGGRVERDE